MCPLPRQLRGEVLLVPGRIPGELGQNLCPLQSTNDAQQEERDNFGFILENLEIL